MDAARKATQEEYKSHVDFLNYSIMLNRIQTDSKKLGDQDKVELAVMLLADVPGFNVFGYGGI